MAPSPLKLVFCSFVVKFSLQITRGVYFILPLGANNFYGYTWLCFSIAMWLGFLMPTLLRSPSSTTFVTNTNVHKTVHIPSCAREHSSDHIINVFASLLECVYIRAQEAPSEMSNENGSLQWKSSTQKFFLSQVEQKRRVVVEVENQAFYFTAYLRREGIGRNKTYLVIPIRTFVEDKKDKTNRTGR